MADPQAALLSLKVCDVACGSGHILLSAARRIGFELARLRTGEDQPTPSVLRHAIGDVIRNCIYGVDKNPLAVELCKVAMWLEAHEPGQPLNFLDHHIKCGDAIVGLALKEELEKGISDEAFKTLPGDEKTISSAFLKRNKQERKQQEQTAFDFDKAANAEVSAILEKYNLFKNLPERTPEEIVNKENQFRQYESNYHRIRLKQLADAQVAQFFIPKNDANKDVLITDAEYRNFLRQVNKHLGILQSNKLVKAQIVADENNKNFFHWFLEFPEVFSKGGFDCILGNPPFLGGQALSGSFGNDFLNNIKSYFETEGSCDLVTYFFRRIYQLLKNDGFQSLISTNSISQGVARENGLDIILKNGGTINFAVRSAKWPGKAAVFVTLISISKGKWSGELVLDNKEVSAINSFLSDSDLQQSSNVLIQNGNKSFMGSTLLGMGFTLTPDEAKSILRQDSKYSEVLFPFLSGENLYNSPTQIPERWVINFGNIPLRRAELSQWTTASSEERKALIKNGIVEPNFLGKVAFDYPVCIEIIERLVKPERLKVNREAYKEKWWHYAEKRPGLYETIKTLSKVLLVAQTSKTVAFSFVQQNQVYAIGTITFAFDSFKYFSLLQSTIHNLWSWKYGSTMKTDLRYSPSDIFETYPFPQNLDSKQEKQLEIIGEFYHEHRRQLMLGTQLGLTKTYNLFHSNAIITQGINDKDKQVAFLKKHLEKTANSFSFDEAIYGILKLRGLHMQMDEVVLEAYGWNNIALKHDFYEVDYLPENDRVRFTIHPDARKEILKRLLELNHKIHAEEVAAIETEKLLTKATKPTKKKKTSDQQIPLLPMRPHTAYDALYGIQDVVHITNLKPKTVGRWMKRLYTRGDYEGVTKETQGGKEQYLLNFYSMHEFIVFADLRLNNKIPMDEILSARAWLKERFKGSMSKNEFYPYTSERVLNTIGKAGRQIIFKDEQTGDQLTLGKGNAQLNLDLLQDILKRIHFDKGMISRLYLSSAEFTAIDPEQAGGRPCVITPDGGISIDTIQSVFKETPDKAYVGRIFKISKEAVEDALAFKKASVFNFN